jgi:hypothetical protein
MNVRKTDAFLGDIEQQYEWYASNARSDPAVVWDSVYGFTFNFSAVASFR